MKNNEILMGVFYRPISRDKGGVYLVSELHVAHGPLLELVRGLPHFEGSELLKCESDDGWAS